MEAGGPIDFKVQKEMFYGRREFRDLTSIDIEMAVIEAIRLVIGNSRSVAVLKK